FSGDPSVYTPLEELPAEIQLLYDYNPTLARQMLDDARVPVGFKMNCVIQSAPPVKVAQGALLVDMWDKIGIEVELEVTETVAFLAYTVERDYRDSLIYGGEVGNPKFCSIGIILL
ncbi:unnamed protein product, partial [marine sediment metagenome]